jgi:hypothetical protein
VSGISAAASAPGSDAPPSTASQTTPAATATQHSKHPQQPRITHHAPAYRSPLPGGHQPPGHRISEHLQPMSRARSQYQGAYVHDFRRTTLAEKQDELGDHGNYQKGDSGKQKTPSYEFTRFRQAPFLPKIETSAAGFASEIRSEPK